MNRGGAWLGQLPLVGRPAMGTKMIAPQRNLCSPFASAATPPCEDICKVSLPRPEMPQAMKDLLSKYNGAIPVSTLSPAELDIYHRASAEDTNNVQVWAAEVEEKTQGKINDYKSRGWSVQPQAARRVPVAPGAEPSFSETEYWVACPPASPASPVTPTMQTCKPGESAEQCYATGVASEVKPAAPQILPFVIGAGILGIIVIAALS